MYFRPTNISRKIKKNHIILKFDAESEYHIRNNRKRRFHGQNRHLSFFTNGQISNLATHLSKIHPRSKIKSNFLTEISIFEFFMSKWHYMWYFNSWSHQTTFIWPSPCKINFGVFFYWTDPLCFFIIIGLLTYVYCFVTHSQAQYT